MVVFCNYGSLFAKNWISLCFTLVLYGCNSNQWKSMESQEQKTRESQWAEHEVLCFIIEICVSSLQNYFYWFFWLMCSVCLSGWLVFERPRTHSIWDFAHFTENMHFWVVFVAMIPWSLGSNSSLYVEFLTLPHIPLSSWLNIYCLLDTP